MTIGLKLAGWTGPEFGFVRTATTTRVYLSQSVAFQWLAVSNSMTCPSRRASLCRARRNGNLWAKDVKVRAREVKSRFTRRATRPPRCLSMPAWPKRSPAILSATRARQFPDMAPHIDEASKRKAIAELPEVTAAAPPKKAKA